MVKLEVGLGPRQGPAEKQTPCGGVKGNLYSGHTGSSKLGIHGMSRHLARHKESLLQLKPFVIKPRGKFRVRKATKRIRKAVSVNNLGKQVRRLTVDVEICAVGFRCRNATTGMCWACLDASFWFPVLHSRASLETGEGAEPCCVDMQGHCRDGLRGRVLEKH